MASIVTEEEPITTTEDMDLENPEPVSEDGTTKRVREENEEENNGVSKKLKVEDDKSVEEVRMEKIEEDKENGEEEKGKEEDQKKTDEPVSLGPKTFGSSTDMFEYFYKLLHHWPTNVQVNKYEHMVLLDLINKGHPEPQKKIASGISAFEIRQHPEWKSRCFFVVRTDESVEDFSFRKCVDHILPLPENMKIKSDVNKALGGGKKHGGGRGGRGHSRGRGGKPRR
ncbi:protein EMBRYO DEFECTIVE 514-like [Amaranthus tricolor]|uniref:protein EMBRYO DEFECTIVE 514-like n=1 Tax=Amaranthus tricolor TaxID=29722 RepID=UPI0025874A1E|nr:protein EMBRYO DEFECTIVE 514-like [Amaranthus tricolor]